MFSSIEDLPEKDQVCIKYYTIGDYVQDDYFFF